MNIILGPYGERMETNTKRLELSSIWALLAAFENPLPIPGVQLIQLIHLASPASLIRREELLHVVIGYLVQAYYRQLWQIISKVMIELALKSLLLV
nr:hypothetical protein CFP56_16136 [Quercus suber]